MKVLLVDDTRTLLSLIQVYLMGWSIDFLEARDGTDGLRLAKEHRPDLVISDVRMPGMDGFELTAAIRSDAQLHATPVILLTSLNDEANRRKGRLVGATAFLSKPVSVEELRRQVGTILRLPDKKGAR
jgi:twitching motility two-component system response regulator PilG